MSSIQVSPMLRTGLAADAIVSGACGLLMLAAPAMLSTLTRLPEGLLFGSGLGLMIYVAIVGWMARRATLPRAGVFAVVACNALWAVDCLWAAFGGLFPVTPVGVAFLVAQALAVAVFAEWQYMGLRRSAAAA